MKKTFVFIFIIAVLFSSCAKKGELVGGVFSPAKEDFKVTFLFEHDGIQIYRFYDAGEYRYFSIGNGSFQPQIQKRTVSTGKSTTTQTWSDGAN